MCVHKNPNGSLSLLEFSLELLSETPVGLEGSVLGKLTQSRVPVVELIEAVTEAESFLHRQVRHISALAALDEALIVKVFHNSVVLHDHRMEVVFGLQSRGFHLLHGSNQS